LTTISSPRALVALASATLLIALVGCGDDDGPTPTPDAGPADGGSVDSGPPDAGPPEPSYLFGPCEIDDQCPGAGAVCRTAPDDGYPGGYCTVPCEDRGVCDDGVVYNHCVERTDDPGQMYCEKRCLNGADCYGFRENYTCAGDIGGAGGVCVGVCSLPEHCAPSADCNVWSGECVPSGTVITGSETGETCAADEGCKSENCLRETGDSGLPTGWIDGYCIGPCILPVGYNSSTFFMGDALPQGSCEGNAVCFPNGDLNQQDLGVCLAACVTDADCRPGYSCLNEIQLRSGPARYDNGVCLPIDCSMEACPTGFTCRTLATTSGDRNVCERS
jgi:hypothetical protein